MTRSLTIQKQRASDAAPVLVSGVTRGETTMPDGSNFVQSSTSPALSVVTPIAPHLNGVGTPATDLQASVAALDKKERARRRRLKEKKALEARRKELRKVPRVPFRPAPLLSVDPYVHRLTAEGLDLYWQGPVRAVWDLGPKAGFAAKDKAARDYVAKGQLLPAEIDAIARIQTDFNRSEAQWGTPAYKAKCEWLERGSGVCAQYGTMDQAHSAARHVISACVSILVELPINYRHDGDAILETLAYTGWCLPRHGRQRAAERMARFVAWRIMGDPQSASARRSFSSQRSRRGPAGNTSGRAISCALPSCASALAALPARAAGQPLRQSR